MTNADIDFDEWFERVCDFLADSGIGFCDADAVREDYEAGKSVFDVVDDIKAEYAD